MEFRGSAIYTVSHQGVCEGLCIQLGCSITKESWFFEENFSKAPKLSFLDFNIYMFQVDCDASEKEIGTILTQERKSVGYTSMTFNEAWKK